MHKAANLAILPRKKEAFDSPRLQYSEIRVTYAWVLKVRTRSPVFSVCWHVNGYSSFRIFPDGFTAAIFRRHAEWLETKVVGKMLRDLRGRPRPPIHQHQGQRDHFGVAVQPEDAQRRMELLGDRPPQSGKN